MAIKGNNKVHLEDTIKQLQLKKDITKEDTTNKAITSEDKEDIIIPNNDPEEIEGVEMTLADHYSNIPDDLPRAYSYFSQGLQNKVSFALME